MYRVAAAWGAHFSCEMIWCSADEKGSVASCGLQKMLPPEGRGTTASAFPEGVRATVTGVSASFWER